MVGRTEPCDYAIAAISEFLEADVPLFDGLGCQLLALVLQPSRCVSVTMANHLVQNLADGTVMITSQNHGFAVDAASLPDNLTATHKSLFDDSLQGIERETNPHSAFRVTLKQSGPQDVRRCSITS